VQLTATTYSRMDGALGKKKTYKPVSPQYRIKKTVSVCLKRTPLVSTGAAVLLIVAQIFFEE